MRAFFYRQISQPLRDVFVVGFLLVCLLGTHWLGFSHGISHSGLATSSQILGAGSQSCDESTTITHSSASCHLFDALTLASFVSADNLVLIEAAVYKEASFSSVTTADYQTPDSPYQSQAPPRFIL
jgi:hypothetical protein